MSMSIVKDPFIVNLNEIDSNLMSFLSTGLTLVDLKGEKSTHLALSEELDFNFSKVLACKQAWSCCFQREASGHYIGYFEWRQPHFSHLEVFYRQQHNVSFFLFMLLSSLMKTFTYTNFQLTVLAPENGGIKRFTSDVWWTIPDDWTSVDENS